MTGAWTVVGHLEPPPGLVEPNRVTGRSRRHGDTPAETRLWREFLLEAYILATQEGLPTYGQVDDSAYVRWLVTEASDALGEAVGTRA
jgi:hypothetical protein